jgi:hypothetical protein
MSLLIVIQHCLDLWNAPAWFGGKLGEEFPGLKIVQPNSYDGIEADLRDAEVIFTISSCSLTIFGAILIISR